MDAFMWGSEQAGGDEAGRDGPMDGATEGRGDPRAGALASASCNEVKLKRQGKGAIPYHNTACRCTSIQR